MGMVFILTCFVYVAYASKNALKVNKKIDVISLVEDTLGECTAIVKAVGDFYPVYDTKDDLRRRSQKYTFATGVENKLKKCTAIADAVDTFRKDYIPWKSGLIGLRLSEIGFVKELLKKVSKGLGSVLYIASKDGDASTKFHSACDNQGPTVVIVKTTAGAVFGGYTDKSWSGAGSWVSSTTSFIFRIHPVKTHHIIKQSEVKHAIYRNPNYGPTFGAGHDIYIASGALSNTNSWVSSGRTYKFNSYPNYQLSDGTKKFQVKEYVVFKAVAL